MRSSRSTRYIAEHRTLQSSDSVRDLDPLERRMFGGPTDSFDRQRSYTSLRAMNQQSLSRNHSYYSPTEVRHTNKNKITQNTGW